MAPSYYEIMTKLHEKKSNAHFKVIVYRTWSHKLCLHFHSIFNEAGDSDLYWTRITEDFYEAGTFILGNLAWSLASFCFSMFAFLYFSLKNFSMRNLQGE